LESVRARMKEKGLDALAVYGDREHFANLAYACGYDPRFEEAILIIPSQSEPAIMVGNEGLNYLRATLRVDCEVLLMQPFSLMGQPRNELKDFKSCLGASGIKRGMRIGTVGWKYFDSSEFEDPETKIEIPAFIVDSLREIVGVDRVVNANDIFIHPERGLRVVNDVHQIAYSEYAATTASDAVHRMIEHLEAGMTEYESVRLMRLNGLPHSFHVVFMSGERTTYGLASPSSRVIKVGDPLIAALGVWGSAVCRAAYVVHDGSELPNTDSNYVRKTCIPYFRMLARWYELLKIGTSADEIYQRVTEIPGRHGFKIPLNPGHLTQLEEWVNTPFFEGSPHRIKSGMLLQSDFIIEVEEDGFGANVEDTVAVADDETRNELEERYPETYKRIMVRRDFVTNSLGIDLNPEVLPLCNNQVLLRPYLLSSDLGIKFD